jgi:hypothetical protein
VGGGGDYVELAIAAARVGYMNGEFILNPLVGPGAMSGASLLAYGFVSSAALWVVVGVVALANGGHLSRQPPLRRQVA